MATLKLTIFKAKALKDGKHKVRIAVCHKQETCYIITRFIIDDLSQFKNGQVVKRMDAAMINTKTSFPVMAHLPPKKDVFHN